MRARLTLSATLALASAPSCTSPATEVLVELDTDLAWGAGATVRSVEVTVRSDGHQGPVRVRRVLPVGRGRGLTVLPVSFGVVPRDGDDQGSWVEALACSDAAGCGAAAALVTQRATTGFVPEATVLLRLYLADACRDVRCEDPRTTCDAGMDAGMDAGEDVPLDDGDDVGADVLPVFMGDAAGVRLFSCRGVATRCASPGFGRWPSPRL